MLVSENDNVADKVEVNDTIETNESETVSEETADVENNDTSNTDDTESETKSDEKESKPVSEETETNEEDVESDEVTVTIGDDEPDAVEEKQDYQGLVKKLRKVIREQAKSKKEVTKKLDAISGATLKPVELGKRPDISEFDFDTVKFNGALDKWIDTKTAVESQEAKQKSQKEKQDSEWQERLKVYEEKKSKLKVSGYAEAEENVQEFLTEVQQGTIIHGADDSAKVIYALGRNPKKLRELASITDPVKFSFAVAKLETKLRVTTKRPVSKPEKTLNSTTSNSGQLDALMEKAAKTGDLSEVVAYKRQIRDKARQS